MQKHIEYSFNWQVIKQDNRDVTDTCFTALLSHWLSCTSPLPTWSVLIDAIKSRPVGYVDVASKIEAMLEEKNVCSVSLSCIEFIKLLEKTIIPLQACNYILSLPPCTYYYT